MEGACGLSYEKCGYLISSFEDNLVKMALVYIADVARNDPVDITKYYVDEFGKYTKELNRGGLTMPGDNMCQMGVLFI